MRWPCSSSFGEVLRPDVRRGRVVGGAHDEDVGRALGRDRRALVGGGNGHLAQLVPPYDMRGPKIGRLVGQLRGLRAHGRDVAVARVVEAVDRDEGLGRVGVVACRRRCGRCSCRPAGTPCRSCPAKTSVKSCVEVRPVVFVVERQDDRHEHGVGAELAAVRRRIGLASQLVEQRASLRHRLVDRARERAVRRARCSP